MRRGLMAAVAVSAALAISGAEARAQYGYPVGYGAYGWGGWGGGGQTVQGDIARGLGTYAAGAGVYNQQTAIARSINTDTVMRWNQYMYESQLTANKAERERLARRQYGTNQAQEKLYKRLRDNPEPRDIYQGDALNVALEEINNPAVYAKALQGAKTKIGGEAIRDIPFQHAAAAISTSIHQITQGKPPAALANPAFAAERTKIRALGAAIRGQMQEGASPDEATVDKAIAAVNALEAKVDTTLARNSRDRVECDKYLKSVHGLLAMMKTPALSLLLAGVEKRPDATLGELLNFMNEFNLRFGPATTPRQRALYDTLYPMLDGLRDQVAPALAASAPPKSSGAEAGEFFSGMQYEDLKKKAPAPPQPGIAKPK
jgi:hypothetical protein